MIEVLITGASAPQYMTSGSAAVDLKAAKAVSIPPGHRALIHTGLHIAMPEGLAALVIPRSGIALKEGVTVLNSPGLVDSDYRGEIGVILQNHSDTYFEVKEGDRVAQLMFIHFGVVVFKQVSELPSTERGCGGFGSSGK